jgi:nucleoside-diphosphate-sugar epimerase
MGASLNFFENRKIVITGVTGFIGSKLAKELLQRKASITAFFRPGSRNTWRISEILDKISIVEINLGDYKRVKEKLRGLNPDFIFHLATYYSVTDEVDFDEIIETNIKAGIVLVRASETLSSLKLFVNVGTCAEYGDLRERADETAPLNPNSIYASTKAASTIILHQLSRTLNVPLTTLRLYNLYGEFEKPGRIVPYVATSLLRGKPVELTGCEQAKDYSYLGDIVSAFLKAAERYENARGEVFNIGSGRTIKVRELVEEIIKQVGSGRELVRFGAKPYRENEMWYQATSIAKAEKLLDWRPQTSLQEGMEKTVAWYKENLNLYE